MPRPSNRSVLEEYGRAPRAVREHALTLRYVMPTHRISMFYFNVPDDFPQQDEMKLVQVFDDCDGFIVTEDQEVYWTGHLRYSPAHYHLMMAKNGEAVTHYQDHPKPLPTLAAADLLPLNDSAS